MSKRLVRPILERLDAKEAAVIEERAREQAAEFQLVDEEIVSATLLKDRAKDLIQAVRSQRDRARYQGFFGRLVVGKIEPLTEYFTEDMEADFLQPTSLGFWDLVKNDKTWYRQSGYRTLFFGIRKESIELRDFELGWQVGFVEKRDIQTRETEAEATGRIHVVGAKGESLVKAARMPIVTPVLGGPFSVRIWEYAREVNSGETEKTLAFDVNPSNGFVRSFTEGIPDDELTAIGKGAGALAFKRMGDAIKFLEPVAYIS